MALTLNKIKNRIETLALAHKQINSFYFGAPSEFDIQDGVGDVAYPACFCEKLDGVTNRDEQLHTYNFRLYFYDLVNVAEGTNENRTDVLSDMDSVALDLLSMMMSAVYQDDWIISATSNEVSKYEQLGDMVGGSVREVGISVEFAADSCQVPQDSVTFNDDFDMARTRLIVYTGTGAEGNSFSPTDDSTGVTLAGRIVIGGFRAGMFKRVITTLPVNTDKIQVVGTDQGDRKGILSTTGVISLQTGDALISGEELAFILWE